MFSYEYTDPDADKPRTHPWTVAESDPTRRYYDFKANPELIRTHLEDFVGLCHWPAVQAFYSLLEWLNGPDSTLESSDCAFRPPGEHADPRLDKSLLCAGRVIIFYRDLQLNTNKAYVESLKEAIHHYLNQIDPDFRWGALGTTIMKTDYVTLPVPLRDQAGFQVMLYFDAWGDSEEETMSNLERLFKNLQAALQGVSSEIREAMPGGE
jgi:hypothetical protein